MKSKRPYVLPYALVCSEQEISEGIKGDLIQKQIAKHNNMLQRYTYLENMYKGFHDIFKGPDKENWKPDNRLAVNFPRYITDTFTGYGYGVPIKVTHPDERVNDAIQLFGRQNEITDHEAEMVKKCCIYGHAFEFMYQNEQHETKVSSISPKELFVVYDNKLSQRALFAVRYGVHPQSSDKAGKTYGEVYTRDFIYRFEDKKVQEAEENPYGFIPCVEWRLNDERMGLFEPITGLVETYNATLGEKANDVDAFAEAYLAILGAELDDDGVACACYAYSIKDGIIDDEMLERIREICAQSLSSGEMRADGSFCKPDEWWDSHPKRAIKAVESGSADSLKQHLAAELYPYGIVLDIRSIKAKHAGELACSAIAWGVSTSFFKKGAYMSTLIHNDSL
jgi:SPP1 family phage portal protein